MTQQEPEISEDQARELITRLVGTAQMAIHPFEFGWVATEILSAEERAKGMHIGQGSYIIDRTGVVTIQRSLPVRLVIAEYSEARREGRLTGQQVWPRPETPAP